MSEGTKVLTTQEVVEREVARVQKQRLHDLATQEAEKAPLRDEGLSVSEVAEQYRVLWDVLKLAYNQSANGKGRERHATTEPFEKQHIVEIGNIVGLGFSTGQAVKKVYEAVRMNKEGLSGSAQFELLGAIVYLAAAYITIDQQDGIK